MPAADHDRVVPMMGLWHDVENKLYRRGQRVRQSTQGQAVHACHREADAPIMSPHVAAMEFAQTTARSG